MNYFLLIISCTSKCEIDLIIAKLLQIFNAEAQETLKAQSSYQKLTN